MTTVPRKKRIVGVVKDANAHYRVLQSLVKGLFPAIDIQDMDKLKEIGQALDIGITTPTDANTPVVETEKNTVSKVDVQLPKLPASLTPFYGSDRLMMDKFGHTHFIGNFGTASLLNGLCDLIIKKSFNINANSTRDIRDNSVQTITSEYKPIYQYPIHLYNNNINVKHFPLIDLVEREDADYYVNVYFENVHPYYFIFNYDKFMETYLTFWDELNEIDKSPEYTSTLTSAQICAIYLIWILGNRFRQYSTTSKYHMTNESISKLVDIIRLSLSDIVLTPSVDSIRLLSLFSVYLSSIKVRESGFCLMELACIQSKSLGLHKKLIVDKFNPEMADVMKRVMWSLAKTESFLCCSFGRSSAIQWDEIDIDLPELKEIGNTEQKIFYLQSIKLTRIIFDILDYKKWSQKEPLSLRSIERALLLKKQLEIFFNDLPLDWQDYKSEQRFKSRLHTHYNYFFITLTLPMFLFIVNSNNYIIKNDDPFLVLVVCGIRSSFKTADIIEYQNEKGMFNGTIYYDVFNCYNAIMVLLLTYILFKISKDEVKPKIDLNNLDNLYQININEILKAINKIRNSLIKNLNNIDGTMKRMSDVIETLLNDLGLIEILKSRFPDAMDSFITELPKKMKPKKETKEELNPTTDISDISWLTESLTHMSSDNTFNSLLTSLNLDPELIDTLFNNGRV